MWIIMTIAAISLLVIYWRGPNVVWGGATLGLVVGLVIAIFFQEGFKFVVLGKGLVIGTLICTVLEWICNGLNWIAAVSKRKSYLKANQKNIKMKSKNTK